VNRPFQFVTPLYAIRLLVFVFLIILLPLFVSGLSSVQAAERDEAYLIGDRLFIPKVAIGIQYYSLSLSLRQNGNEFDFLLTEFSELTVTNSDEAISFENNQLIIPKLVVNGSKFRIALSLFSTDPVTLRLVNYSEVDTEVKSAKELFRSDISRDIVSSKCALCHTSTGVASNTRLRFETNSSVDLNFEALSKFLQEDIGNDKLLLGKIAGENHGGGVQLPKGSSEYLVFEQFLELFALGGSTSVSSQASLFDGAVFESKLNTLRRAALLFAGRIPSDREVEEVRQGDAGILRATIRKYMEGVNFREFLVRGVNDRLLTESVTLNYDIPNFPISSQKTRDLAVSFGFRSQPVLDYQSQLGFSAKRAAGELVNHIAQEEKSYTEVVTANYMMMNPVMAEAMGATVTFEDRGNFLEFKPATIEQYYQNDEVVAENCYQAAHAGCDILSLGTPTAVPLSGVLTDTAFLERYPFTPTNRNRARAKAIFYHFLGIDIENSADRPLDKASLSDTNNPTLNNPNCTVCHEILDPVAGGLQNWTRNNLYLPWGDNSLPQEYRESSLYRIGDHWFRDMLKPGLQGIEIEETWNTAQKLGDLIASHPNFSSGTVKFWWEAVFGLPLIPVPTNTEQDDYATKLAAYNAQQASIAEFSQAFERNFNLKDLLVQMVDSPWFSLGQLPADSPLARQAVIAIGNERLLSPEELSTKIYSLTGLRWRILQHGSSIEDALTNVWEYRLLYGGIDGDEKVSRDRLLTPVSLTTAIKLAAEMSCSITLNEFSVAEEERYLLKNVSQYTTPRALDSSTFELANLPSTSFQTYTIPKRLTPDTASIGITVLNTGSGSIKISALSVTNIDKSVSYPIPLYALSGSKYCYYNNAIYWMGGLCTFEIPYQPEYGTNTELEIAASVDSQVVGESRSIVVSSLGPASIENNNENASVLAIKTQIQSLLYKMHGTSVTQNSDIIDAYYEIFDSTLKESAGQYWFNKCSPAIDFTLFRNHAEPSEIYVIQDNRWLALNYESQTFASLAADINLDPFQLKAAWSAVLFALMSDYDFLVE